MKVHDYIETHQLYGKFIHLYEEFLFGDKKESSGRRYTDSMTLDIECLGQVLVASNKIGDVEGTKQFIEHIFEWSGPQGPRIRGQLFNYKDKTEYEKCCLDKQIAETVKKSAQYLERDELESAIAEITALKGLDISYGSKILRMLAPQKAGVMDSYMQKAMPSYPMTPAKRCGSWANFCGDCKEVANTLHEKGIKNRFRIDGEWYIADVEVAIYRHIDKKRPKKKAGQ